MYTSKQILEGLRLSVDACKTVGVDLQQGRIARAMEILDAITLTKDAGVKVDSAEIATAMIESIDISSLHQFPREALERASDVLKRLPSGSFSYADAGSDDQGRDIAFEVGTGRSLAEAGARVTFNNPSDVDAVFGGYRLGVECKRAKSGKAIGHLLVKGAGQIEGHRKAGHRHPFVIAMDLTRAINPEAKILVRATEDEAIAHIHACVERLFRDNSQFIAESAPKRP